MKPTPFLFLLSHHFHVIIIIVNNFIQVRKFINLGFYLNMFIKESLLFINVSFVSGMADKLKRFLVLGSASSTYIACHERQVTNILPVIPGLDQLVLEGKEEEIVQILTNAAGEVSSGLTDPVVLAHATSLCIKSDSSRLRQLTYQALTSICLTSEGLFRVLEAIRVVTATIKKGGSKLDRYFLY